MTGTHGGIEHVLVDFEPDVLDKMAISDKIQVRACGQGLEIDDFPGVRCMNLDPGLLDKMGVAATEGGVLEMGRSVQLHLDFVPAHHLFRNRRRETQGSSLGLGTGSK